MLSRFFKLAENDSTIRQEILAGITTFVTMAYIIIVNPQILEVAGIPVGPSFTATVLATVLGTLLMALYARRPFAVAPYMGENAFISYTVVTALGYTWQDALGAIFISGLVFAVLTLLNIRTWLVHAIPMELKIGFSVGIGLFLTFIGLNTTGIVALGVPGAPVHVGNFTDPTVLMAIFGFMVTGFLMIRNVPGAFILGILLTTGLALILGFIEPPTALVSLPPDITPIFGRLNILSALRWEFFPIILTVLVMIFVDTMGTLIGVSYKAGFLDRDGNLPEIEKPMLSDSLATMGAAVMGTTTSGVFVESAAGIQAGGRTGLTALVTAILFLGALFFSPILTIVPPYAYGPVLILVGMLMLSPVKDLDVEDISTLIPVFTIIVLMSFTYNIGIGMTAGFILYPLTKVLAGKARHVPVGLWVLGALSLLFFLFYPYG